MHPARRIDESTAAAGRVGWSSWVIPASLLYAAALYLAGVLASRDKSALLWGIHQGAFLSPGAKILFFALPFLLLLVLLVPGRPKPAKRRPPREGLTKVTPLLLMVVAPIVFWLFRDRTHLLGDGMLIIADAQGGEEASRTAPLADRLAGWIGYLAGGGEGGAERGLALLSVIAGAFFVLLAWLVWRELASEPRERWLGFTLFLLHPTLLLFCGYIEFYPVMWVFAMLLILLGLWRQRGRIPAGVPEVAWAIGVAYHSLLLLYLPVALGLPPAPRAARPEHARHQRTRSWRRYALHILGTLALGVGALALAEEDPRAFIQLFTGGKEGSAFLPLSPRDPVTEAYGLLAPHHFLELLNEMLLVMPLLPLAPLWARLEGRRAFGGPARLLALVGAIALVPFLLLNPRLGMARDWDLMAFPAIPLNLLAIHVLLNRPPGGHPRWEKSRGFPVLVVFLLGWGLARTASWITLHHDPSLAVARARSIAAESRLNAPFARSYLYEDLSRYLQRRGDLEGATAEIRRAHALRPEHPRLVHKVGMLALEKGDLAEAEQAFLRAVALDSLYAPSWNSLGVTYVRGKDPVRAETAFRRAVACDPRSLSIQMNLALDLLYLRRPDEALEVARSMTRQGRDRQLPGALDNLARAFASQGLMREAEIVRGLAGTSAKR